MNEAESKSIKVRASVRVNRLQLQLQLQSREHHMHGEIESYHRVCAHILLESIGGETNGKEQLRRGKERRV